jgi:hypothetical protein
MYVKLTNGEIEQFPYTLGDFRRDNSYTGFPRIIPKNTLRSYGVFPVYNAEFPLFDTVTQNLVQNSTPQREVLRNKVEKDVTDPDTGDINHSQLGQPIYGKRWLIGYTVENKPLAEAEYNLRKKRNLLIADTDKLGLTDRPAMSDEYVEYRQALRDITAQEGFPYTVSFPNIPE